MYSLFVLFISEYLIFLLLFCVSYFFLKKDYFILIKILFSMVLTYSLRKFLNLFLYEPRPYTLDLTLLVYPVVRLADSSFFSTHASISAALAASVYPKYKKFGTFLFIGAAIVALGRVLAAMHYLWDVAAGFLIGSLIAMLVSKGFKKLNPRLKKYHNSFLDI